MVEYESYWDWVSVQDTADDDSKLKHIFKECYTDLSKNYLKRLMFIESDFIYLSYICNLTQQGISKIYGVTQLCVSKRINSGIKKLRTLLLCSEFDTNTVNKDIKFLCSKKTFEYVIAYYHLRNYNLVGYLLNDSSWIRVRDSVKMGLDEIRDFYNGNFDLYFSDLEKYKQYKQLQDNLELDSYKDKAKQYYDLLSEITEQSSYGDNYFKPNSKINIKRISLKDIK